MELKTRQRPSDWLRRAIIYFYLSLLTLFVVGVGWLGVDGCGWVWMGVDGRMSMSRLSLLSLPSLFPLLSSLFSPFFVSPPFTSFHSFLSSLSVLLPRILHSRILASSHPTLSFVAVPSRHPFPVLFSSSPFHPPSRLPPPSSPPPLLPSTHTLTKPWQPPFTWLLYILRLSRHLHLRHFTYPALSHLLYSSLNLTAGLPLCLFLLYFGRALFRHQKQKHCSFCKWDLLHNKQLNFTRI